MVSLVVQMLFVASSEVKVVISCISLALVILSKHFSEGVVGIPRVVSQTQNVEVIKEEGVLDGFEVLPFEEQKTLQIDLLKI